MKGIPRSLPMLRVRADARCVDTRLFATGVVMRRYVRSDGTQFKTMEIPAEVWAGLNNQSWGKDRMGGWVRARERESLRSKAIKLHGEGWKPLAISSELGVPCRTIHRWVKHDCASIPQSS